MASRIRQLTMPVADQAAARRLKDTQAIQLRQAATQVPPTATQQVGAASATQAGQAGLQAAGQSLQREQAVAGLEQGEQQLQRSAQLSGQQQALGQKELQVSSQLARLSQEAARLESDSRLNFMREESRGKYLTERNYNDYLVRNAKSNQQYQDVAQASQLAHERKVKLLDAAHDKINQQIKQMSAAGVQDIRGQSRSELARRAADLKVARDRAAAEASNKQAMYKAGGTVLGTVVGGVVGSVVPGVGTAIGASAGGAIGGGLGSLLSR